MNSIIFLMIQSKQYLNYMNTIKKGYVLVNVNLYNKINFEINITFYMISKSNLIQLL